jgi:hypothetical protein
MWQADQITGLINHEATRLIALKPPGEDGQAELLEDLGLQVSTAPSSTDHMR